MSVNNNNNTRNARPLILIVLAVIFAGFILYSAISVRYSTGTSPKSEFKVTELSLTHEIVRDKDGKLVVPAESDSSSGKKTKKPKSGGKACPT